jgi:penicillin-binding protein 1A
VVGVYIGFDNPAPLGHGETGGNVSAPVVRDFFKTALADQPPIPFRAPPGIHLVRVNKKTGLPASPGDPSAIMEAFKPLQDPTGGGGVVEEGDDQAVAADGYSQPSQAGPPGLMPGQMAPAAPPPGAYPAPGNDRALTSGTGGLY